MRHTRRMFQELLDRRSAPTGASREPRNVLLDGCSRVQPMLLDEKGDQRVRHRLRDGGDPETRVFAVRNTQLPAGKAVSPLEDDTVAPLDENDAAEEIGARLGLDQ